MKTTRTLLIVVLALGLAAEVAPADFAFGTPTNLGLAVNSSALDSGPSISADGLSLFFHSDRPGGLGDFDLYMTSRETTGDDWGSPVNLGPTVNSSAGDTAPSISADGLSLYFHSGRPGGFSFRALWLSTRMTTDDPWGAPVNLGPSVNSSVATQPAISADGLSLFFASERSGGFGDDDIWVTTRATIDDDWGAPVNLGPAINTSVHDGHPSISADGSTLYFASRRPGGVGSLDIWQVSISPVVDFNADGKVDIKDLVRLIESWGQDDPSVDIAPGLFFGDGVVDVKDLEVLMRHWQQEANDPTLMANWKLDETEGDIAYDGAGTHDAVAVGDPLWQPDGGRVNGALRLDGVDDGLIADRVLNPSDGPFSVFAWIKGGAPGQVILSQGNGINWLAADEDQGALRTDISDPVKSARGATFGGLPLISPASIIDGNWHRVGFIWDGAHRILYVDDIEVARDTVENLASIRGDIYIGAGKDLAPGSFWSGLIDDVRIHARVVAP